MNLLIRQKSTRPDKEQLGGYTQKKLGRSIQPASRNQYPSYLCPNCAIFPTLSYELALKSNPYFRPAL